MQKYTHTIFILFLVWWRKLMVVCAWFACHGKASVHGIQCFRNVCMCFWWLCGYVYVCVFVCVCAWNGMKTNKLVVLIRSIPVRYSVKWIQQQQWQTCKSVRERKWWTHPIENIAVLALNAMHIYSHLNIEIVDGYPFARLY